MEITRQSRCSVEVADRDGIYENSKHPYTEALLSSVPIPDPLLERSRPGIPVKGESPSLLSPPGCRFQFRCPLVTEQCRGEEPPLEQKSANHWAVCCNP